jgi:hypothetical protein
VVVVLSFGLLPFVQVRLGNHVFVVQKQNSSGCLVHLTLNLIEVIDDFVELVHTILTLYFSFKISVS